MGATTCNLQPPEQVVLHSLSCLLVLRSSQHATCVCAQQKSSSESKSLEIQYMGFYMIYLYWDAVFTAVQRHSTLKVQVGNISQSVSCRVYHSTFRDKSFISYGYIYSQPLPQFGNKAVFTNKPDKGSLNVPLLYFAYLWDGWAELFKVRHTHKNSVLHTLY